MPKGHTGLDLLFADVPENLPVPKISSSLSDIPPWNKRASSYFNVLFDFATSILHDNGVLVLVHAAASDVTREVYNWAHTFDFHVAEDWFGMSELDLQSPTLPTGVVSYSSFHSLLYNALFCLSFCLTTLPNLM